MITTTIRTELKLLIRERGFLLVSLLLIGLVWFANLNGMRQWNLRNEAVTTQLAEKKQDDAEMLVLAEKIIAEGDEGVGFYDNPLNPMGVGWKHPRLAAFFSEPMSIVATGQSDIFRHTSKISVYGEGVYNPDLKEMRSPIQQMFGFFDLSVVLIYLLPLFALGISYNLVAADRERGSLQLMTAHGLDVKKWLFARISARYAVTMAMLGVAIIISFGVLGVLPKLGSAALFRLAGITALYGALWFTISYLVNLRKGSSATHGFYLIAIWAFALLIVPGGISQLTRSLYPLPSRVGMVNEVREAVSAAEATNSETFQQFYQKHPDLKPASEARQGSGRRWFMNYFAIQAEAWRSIQPLLETFDSQLEKRGRLTDGLGVLSPAIPFSKGLSQVSGTSRAHYLAWQEAVGDFGLQWRAFVFPKVFHDQWLTPETLADLPELGFDASDVATNLSFQVWLMVIQLSVLLVAAVAHPTPRHISLSP